MLKKATLLFATLTVSVFSSNIEEKWSIQMNDPTTIGFIDSHIITRNSSTIKSINTLDTTQECSITNGINFFEPVVIQDKVIITKPDDTNILTAFDSNCNELFTLPSHYKSISIDEDIPSDDTNLHFISKNEWGNEANYIHYNLSTNQMNDINFSNIYWSNYDEKNHMIQFLGDANLSNDTNGTKIQVYDFNTGEKLYSAPISNYAPAENNSSYNKNINNIVYDEDSAIFYVTYTFDNTQRLNVIKNDINSTFSIMDIEVKSGDDLRTKIYPTQNFVAVHVSDWMGDINQLEIFDTQTYQHTCTSYDNWVRKVFSNDNDTISYIYGGGSDEKLKSVDVNCNVKYDFDVNVSLYGDGMEMDAYMFEKLDDNSLSVIYKDDGVYTFNNYDYINGELLHSFKLSDYTNSYYAVTLLDNDLFAFIANKEIKILDKTGQILVYHFLNQKYIHDVKNNSNELYLKGMKSDGSQYLTNLTLNLSSIPQNSEAQLLTKEMIDNYPTGWSLVGSSEAVEDLSLFDDVSLVWKWNNGTWEAYSNNPYTKTLIENSNFSEIQTIEPNSGFWIKK